MEIRIDATPSRTASCGILVDVSPLALRMSSPFNAGYWLAAAA